MFVRPKRALRAVLISVTTGLASVCLLAAQGASVAAAQQNQSALDQIASRGSLRCGIPIGGLPVAAKDASGNIIGSVPDMCAEMAKSLGVKLEIVDTPTPDRIPFVQTGKIDLTIGTITLERAKAVGFSTPWVVDGTAAAFLNSSGITSYDQIHGKQLAVVTGATGDLVATSRYADNTISRVDLASTAIQSVLSGQADAVFDDFSTLSLAAADNPNLMVLDAIDARAERRHRSPGRPAMDQLAELLPGRLLLVRRLDLRLRQGHAAQVVQDRAPAAQVRLLIQASDSRGR